MAKQKKQSGLLTALVYIVVGVLFCIFQDQIVGWILTVVGGAFIIDGIVKIINKNTANGLVEIVVGAIIIIFGWELLWVAMLVFGALLIVSAIQDYAKSNKKTIDLVRLIVGIVVGVLLITSGFKTLGWLFAVVGVVLVIEGLLKLWAQIKK